MPIFEEKLICPLAIRFTQEHIRPVFQDGIHEIEDTIKLIETRPGQGDYDVILSAPFPNIEIVRWYQQGELRDRDDKHWFTLDNRRLYCLQRCAAALWPRRCAAVVEVLYVATEGIRRKDNSSSAGKTVGIGHSMKQLVGRWDWRQAVPADLMEGPAAKLAEETITTDEGRPSVKELLDAPAPPSMLDLFFQAQEVGPAVPQATAMSIQRAAPATATQASSRKQPRAQGGGSGKGGVNRALPTTSEATSSTGEPSTPRSASGSDNESDALHQDKRAEEWVGFPALNAALSGNWRGEKGEIYELRPRPDKASWTCVRTDASIGSGSRRFTLWYDQDSDAVWWGNSWNLYLKASQVRQGKTKQVSWVSDREDGRQKQRFLWRRPPVDSADAVQEPNQAQSVVDAAAEVVGPDGGNSKVPSRSGGRPRQPRAAAQQRGRAKAVPVGGASS
jgi:hypothetical protein